MGAKRTATQEDDKQKKTGRTPKLDRQYIVLKNGLYKYQWEWFQREARNKIPPVDAAQELRFGAQAYIDQVEKSRTPINDIVQPEDDEKFEQLVKKSKKSKSHKSNTRRN